MVLDDHLASLLGKYPAIWDKRCAAFKNKIKKENAYKELAEKLNISVDALHSRYKALREKYRKEKLKIENATRSGSSQIDFEPWYLMETLSFLDAVQVKRRTTTNISCSDESVECPLSQIIDICDIESANIEEIEEFNTDMSEMEPNSAMEPIPSTSGQSTPRIRSKRFDENSISSGRSTPTIRNKKMKVSPALNVEAMVSQLVVAAETTANAATSASSNMLLKSSDLFGKYVGESLSQIKEDYRDDAELEIQQILHKYKKQSKNL